MNSPALHNILAQAEQFHTDGRLEEAADLYRRILTIKPGLSRTAYNLGILLLELQNYHGAGAAFEQCLAIEPHLLEARLNHAFALQEQGRITDALTRYQTIISTTPDCIEARFNLACLQLLQGNLSDGLNGYELRFSTNAPVTARHGTMPLWDGSSRPGLRLLIHAEQGYGDTLQMLRYLPMLANDGLEITLEVPAPLYRLCSRIDSIHCVERGTPLPELDYQLPIMSLPRVMKATLSSIPGTTPYLTPDPELVSQWRHRLPEAGGLRVGLAWAGRMDLPVNRKRSCPPPLLQPLLATDRVSFISLQVAAPEGFQLSDPRLLDCSADLTDFDQTAALIATLDLVITIDSAVAHLAGALGVPTWLMLPTVPDWRWLLERNDSPWYPEMQLFRQPAPGAWETVISTITEQLSTACSPRIWCYHDGRDFHNNLTATRPTPLSDRSQWPALGLREADSPVAADWLLFPYYLEHLAEYHTIEGMWHFLEQLPWFKERQEHHILFSDHDCEAPYHSSAHWFRASVHPRRHDPAVCVIPYQVAVPPEQLHFDLSRIRHHVSFAGFLGLLRERAPMLNGVIAEPRLVHMFDLTTSFHLHQATEVREQRRQRYLEISSASICILCPRGDGSSSIRFFEALALGRIAVVQEPVLLPFSDRIDYTRFVISIPRDRLDQAGTIIFNWLAALGDEELLQRCREARFAWEQHLSPAALPRGVVRQLNRQMLARPSKWPEALPGHDRDGWQQQMNRAAVLLLKGKPLEARQQLAAALQINPRSALLQVTMGGIEQELGNDRSAEAYLLDAIQYDHRCYDAYLLLAGLLARTNRPVEAVGRFYQASLIRPAELLPYQLAQPLLLQLGRQDEATYCQEQITLLSGSGAAA
ncbi:tetratricopeptide repeat protein [Trichlorobacter lovleyi]|uniref:Exostosin family protein n=1 Tax=Trichlorobacter lovleyi (strain ATCC BAA-1151 / DSM 17278 / SZ) TaxID=398767 RepID=B3EBM0_TRIL1|nr:tetratricopeptide repeat protein [Trichlorobacter lovleyi]ACD97059.1 Exostosin family protein [Trichlorobacter lovleyi SZ]